MGYWKGSGLALFLDILATVLSGGSSTREVSTRDAEYGVSQVFMAIDTSSINTNSNISEMVRQIVDDVKQSIPSDPNTTVRYPSENVESIRKENEEFGVPVDQAIWKEINQL